MGEANVIIKKVKKVSGEGHHGGAWKVAYADFVTAMMAFFLLMWLLNATTEDQRKGIADYFNPTIPVSQISGGGADALNGETVFSDNSLAKDGSGGAKTDTLKNDKDGTLGDDLEALEKAIGDGVAELQQNLRANINNDENALSKHIQMRVTPEGLVIELVDIDGSPLFESGSARASRTMRLLLAVVSNNLQLVTNSVAIDGHTDGVAFTNRKDYTNWELSSDRANMARRLLVRGGLASSQVQRITGKADTQPLVEDKAAPQNRRISITILKS